ncbi:MAG: hypothetical protein P4M08_05820 [Oligoflexia bacterium]|nr:hypothetical protein [Oligoflexia bacterium]
MKIAFVPLFLGATVAGLPLVGSAQTASSSTPQAASQSAPQVATQPSETASPTPNKKNKKSGKRTREKEAEGTEARDRFKADSVIKSKYKLDGQPLEVDPD